MIQSFLTTPYSAILEKAVSASSLRHKVISNNIANVNTPKFKKSVVSFEDKLVSALQPENEKKLGLATTHEKHFPCRTQQMNLDPSVHTVEQTTYRVDGSNVDIDIEMADMAKNNIYYNGVVQQLSRQFSGLRSAIYEGRR